MIRIPPVLRITLSLVLLTVSMLFVADFAGFAPNETRAGIDARKKLSEALAIQLTVFVQHHMTGAAMQAVEALVERNDDVVSAALRHEHDGIVVEAGPHSRSWMPPADGKSTPTQVLVPISSGYGTWGHLEIVFEPLAGSGLFNGPGGSLAKLALFLLLSGLVSYFLLIKRVLRELDPSKVIPARVKATLDALAEGVVILDEQGDIVLANAGFTNKIGSRGNALIGKNIGEMGWQDPATGGPAQTPPWRRTLADLEGHTGVPLVLPTGSATRALTFMVNASPILDGAGKLRGVVATFDDVTELERKNTELAKAMELLKASQREVEDKNDRLKKLASEDSLTGCLNRRALFADAQRLFDKANAAGEEIACIMGDIDHFKRINDTYGHAQGDHVIREVSGAMKSGLREKDIIGRYGGEEFCMFLPLANTDATLSIVERIRNAIARADMGFNITCSFGVSSLRSGAQTVSELVDQADKALYYSKRNGRNRATVWNPALVEQDPVDSSQPNTQEVAPSASIASLLDRIHAADSAESGVALLRLEAGGGSDRPSARTSHP